MGKEEINALMIIDTLGIGGAEVSLRSLTTAMVGAGCKVVVLVIKDDVTLKMDDKVCIEVLGYKKYRYLPSAYVNAIRLKKMVKNLESKYGYFDLKVANLTLSHKLANLARLKNTYYCIHENIVVSNLSKRSGIRKFVRELRIQRLFKNKDIIVVSNGVRNSLNSMRGLHCKSVQMIYNPIDVTAIKRLSNEHNPYDKLEYIVHVGRLASEKRHDLLLDAYVESGINCALVLVGDGPNKDQVVNKINRMKLGDKVIIAGFVENPYPIIKNAKLLVLSSDYEGFGVVLAEALCLKTAVVSTDCESGPSEIMSSSLSDYLVSTGDATGLACKINKATSDVNNDAYPMNDADIERFLPDAIVRQYISLAD